jgi:hypothetical protein
MPPKFFENYYNYQEFEMFYDNYAINLIMQSPTKFYDITRFRPSSMDQHVKCCLCERGFCYMTSI